MHDPHEFRTVESLGGGVCPDLLITLLTLPPPVVEQILESAGKAWVEVLLNAGLAKTIPERLWRFVTHLVINEIEAAILSGRDGEVVGPENCGDVARGFLGWGVGNVVITFGEKGANFARWDGRGGIEDGHVPARIVEVVDITGAGDTFVGAYASDYVRQKIGGSWDIKKAVERATRASAYSIAHVGAQAGMPWAEQIDEVLD